MQDDDRGTLSKRELTRIGHREFAAVQILELSPFNFRCGSRSDLHPPRGIESMSRGSSVLDERPSKDTPLLEQRIGTLHVWMAPAWQEIIWRAAQRSLAVMCPAC